VLALAVGILVDESTVEVENIHTQFAKTDSIAMAVRLGNAETAVPRLLAMLCVLAVFIPSFLMQGSAKALFVPLSLAVGFAMIGSYLLSSTLVPVLSIWLLKGQRHHDEANLSVLQRLLNPVLAATSRMRFLIVPLYLGIAGLAIYGASRVVGTDIFPAVDAGQFQFRIKAPAGTRIEETEQIAKKALEIIKSEAGQENVEISLGYLGVVPSSYPINSVYLWMGGPEEAVMRVKFKSGKVRIEELKSRLRKKLGEQLPSWLEEKWLNEGVPPERARQAQRLTLSFEPADIVNDVMSFGSPTPVEVQISGTNMADNRAFAEKVYAELAKVSALKDVQYGQALDYPAYEVDINRERSAGAGVHAESYGTGLAPATSSSRFTVPIYWREPKSGISYQVQVEVPQALMKSKTDIETTPVMANGHTPFLVRDGARVKETTMPGQIDRYNMRKVVSITANIEGTDLGDVAVQVAKAIEAAGMPPQGVLVDVRGQVTPMKELQRNLGQGLLAAVAVIFLLLTAYYQSVRLALTAVAAVPAVLVGVAIMLLATGTTLNLQSFMGTIMAVGVAVANAILLVTFAERYRHEGMSAVDAGVHAARTRMRPILMTSAAMIAGMIPMAIGVGEGGDQVAPLGRAVIGGLIASTFATLVLLPAVFALLMNNAGTQSRSLDPYDPQSAHHVR
jgi:multidrug efflux pump subunit AcrB